MNGNIKKRNIWIFHHYATPPNINGFTRPYDLGVNLINKGYNVTVFAASFLHLANVNLIDDKRLYIINNDSDIPFVFINTPSYGDSYIKRIINMGVYYKRLFTVTKKYIENHQKPDLIIASSPHPLTMVAGIKIAKKLGIPCICEVRDLWPEVFFMDGIIKKETIVGKLLLKGERWIYKEADAIIFLKEGDYTYITDNKWDIAQGGGINLDKCHYINNGVDIEKFYKQMNNNILDDPDLNNNKKFNVVYTGAIRPINNVGNILDAASLLKDYKDIQFLIYGDGNQLEDLKQRVINEQLTNVKLKGYVDKKYIPYVLSRSSVNILNYSQKYNWSRGNSSNKLFEYMASGKPIISTVKMGYCLLEKYNCGLSLERNTPEELAKTILKVYEMPEETYRKMGQNGKQGVRDFDYKVLTQKLISVMESYI